MCCWMTAAIICWGGDDMTTYFKDLATATDAAGVLDGTEVLPIIQGGATVHATVDDIIGLAPATTVTSAIGYAIDGGGAVITTGQLKGCLLVPYDCTIESVTLLANASGSIVVDIWKDTYANYPPTNADSICASAKPTLSSAAKSQDTTLTGWTKTISAGDVLVFNVDSASTVQHVTLVLKVTR